MKVWCTFQRWAFSLLVCLRPFSPRTASNFLGLVYIANWYVIPVLLRSCSALSPGRQSFSTCLSAAVAALLPPNGVIFPWSRVHCKLPRYPSTSPRMECAVERWVASLLVCLRLLLPWPGRPERPVIFPYVAFGPVRPVRIGFPELLPQSSSFISAHCSPGRAAVRLNLSFFLTSSFARYVRSV